MSGIRVSSRPPVDHQRGYSDKYIKYLEENKGKDEDHKHLLLLAGEYIFLVNRVSISNFQRTFRVGYNVAEKTVKALEKQGLVSPPKHDGGRKIIPVNADDNVDFHK
jgi:DNA segregation ATPase FtsK/SpoIIIE-like protein